MTISEREINVLMRERAAPEIPLVAPINLALSRWRLLVFLPAVCGLLAASYGLLRRQYVAQSSFISESTNRPASPLLGLATQFGINLGGMGETVSPDFYSWLLLSRGMLTEVVRTPYRAVSETGDSVSGTLIDLFDVTGETPVQRERAAVRRLFTNTTVGIDRAAGVITLRTAAQSPGLAEGINRRFLDLLNTFNVERRQTSAAAQRDFAKARVAQAQEEVAQAEDAMRVFLLRNRRVQNAPELMMEQARLQRVLALRQQVLTTLSQAYEQTRVDAVKDTPFITVVEPPEGSARTSAGLVRRAVLGGIVGFMVALLIVVVGEYARRQREVMPEEYEEFSRRWARVVGWARTLRLPKREGSRS